MNLLAQLWRALTRRRTADREMEEEFRFHVEMEAADLGRTGLDPAEARRRAAVAFGGLERYKEAARDGRRFAMFDDLLRDARYTLRQLRLNPVFAAVVIATLAIGIGAGTAVFSVVNSVLLRPLPFADPDRLIAIDGLSYKGEFHHFRTTAQTFDPGAFTLDSEVTVTGRGDPRRLLAAQLTPELFAVLGVGAHAGRTFTSNESAPGGAPVVMIGTRLWREQFGADQNLVGQQLVVDGVSRTVVGVMPSHFRVPSRSTDLWLPLVIDTADAIQLWSTNALMLGRLRPGVSIEQARAEVRAQLPALRPLFPWKMPADYGSRADVVPLHERVVGDIRPTLLVLLAAALVMLVLVSVNVANLMLARGVLRERELAIRTAIGAGRARLVRQLLAESLTMALVAGALGVLLAWWSLGVLVPGLPPDIPRIDEIRIDARALGFALLVSSGAGLLFGLIPAVRGAGARADTGALRPAAAAGVRQRRTAAVLTVAEIALAVVLVIAATLLLKSVNRLLAVDPGFQSERLVVAGVSPPAFRYGTPLERRAFATELAERARQLPGVRLAAVGSSIPLGGATYGSVFSIEGRPDPASQTGEWPWAEARVAIDGSFLTAMGIPVLEGRAFSADDRADAPRVALVSRSLANQYWPAQSPLGARIRFPGQQTWITIVGIVGDVRWHSLAESRNPALFLPLSQSDLSTARLVLRTDSEPAATAAALRRLVASIDADAPVTDIGTGGALLAGSVAKPRVTAVLLGLFAAVALLLGGIGVYGVLACAVSSRTREIGVRMALGAHPRDVRRLVLRHGSTLAVTGALCGVTIAWAVTRGMSSILFEVDPADPAIFAAVPALLIAVALLASSIPARRAARVDPLIALRTDT